MSKNLKKNKSFVDLLSPVEGLIAEAGLCQNSPDLEFYPDELEVMNVVNLILQMLPGST